MPSPSRALAVVSPAILALVLAGCNNGGGGGGGDIAQVNDQKLARSDFYAKLEAVPQAKSVLTQMVQTALIDQYAEQNHVDISDADITKKEDDIKSKYPPGQFDKMVAAQGLAEADIRKILREQIVVEKAVTGNAKVSDADIAAYLAKNHTTLDTPMQVRAKHILVADLPTAEKIESQLKGGADFAALAKQYSTDPSSKDKGGELGFFGKGQMVPTFQTAAFSQAIGVVGPPIKSPFGYHIIDVEEKKPATVATIANSGPKIKETLMQQQQQQQIPLFLAGLRSKATIQIFDDKLKDALPPVPPAGAAGAPAAGAPPAGAAAGAAPAASPAGAPSAAAPSPAAS